MWEVVHKVLKNIGESVIAANISVKCDFLPIAQKISCLYQVLSIQVVEVNKCLSQAAQLEH